MAKYPVITAGQRLNASLLSSMLPEVIVKSSVTSRTTTSFSDDPELTTTLAGGAVYLVEFRLIAGGGTTGDFQTEWGVPSGASGLKNVLGPGSSSSTSTADNISMRSGTHQFNTDITYGMRTGGNTNGSGIVEWGVVTTTTAGTCALRWSQAASDATASQLFNGSLMIVTRLA